MRTKIIFMVAFLLMTITSALAAEISADAEEAMRAQIQKARKVLAGSTWTVYTALEQEGVKRPEEGTETFTFTDRRVTTENLAKLGYAPGGSNYSVRYENDGVLVWETMQSYKGTDGGGEALLRGDLKDDVMVGVIDIHPSKGIRKIYHFSSQKEKPQPAAKASTTATEESAAAITPATTTTTVTTTTTTKDAKKKGGWW